MKSIEDICQERTRNIEAANRQCLRLETNHPIALKAEGKRKAKRMLQSKERMLIKQMSVSGRITDEDEDAMLEEVGKQTMPKG